MIKILKALLILSIFSVLTGPILAIPVASGINIYLSDVVIGLIGLICLINIKKLIRLISQNPTAKYFLVFAGISLLSLILTPLELSINEKFVSTLYLVRFLLYFSLFPTVIYLSKSKSITASELVNLLIISGLLLSIFGWVQYFLYPDLRNLYYLGWDPHYKRIFGTLLDPNYLGLFLVMTLILQLRKKPSAVNWFIRAFMFLTLLFTYSRGSFLALFVALFGYAWMNRRFAFLIGAFLLFLIAIPLLPRPQGESVKLERLFSVTDRLNNWRQGVNIFLRYPLFGVGFNMLRYAKIELGIKQDNLVESHSGAGIDNSFLFALATSGIIGFLSYLLLLKSVYQGVGMTGKVVFLAIITHSVFINSLFLPWVLVWLWILAAVKV